VAINLILILILLSRSVGALLENKQERLLVAVQTHFMSRHFCLHVLREMRLSKLKAMAKADFRDLLRVDHVRSPPNDNSAPEDQRKVGTSPSVLVVVFTGIHNN